AAQRPQLALSHPQQVTAPQERLALDDDVGIVDQAEQRQHADALARSRLADDAEHLAGMQLEVETVDRLHHALLGAEGDAEPAQREQRLGHAAGSQKLRATRSNTSTQRSSESSSTHSAAVCSPAPDGPYTTHGIPASTSTPGSIQP